MWGPTTKSDSFRGLSPEDEKSAKKVGYSTFRYVNSKGEEVIRFHRMDIIVFSKDRQVATLNTGGWRTVTTKKKMNQFLQEAGFKQGIYQKDFEWFVWDRQTDTEEEFFDGMNVER